MREDRGLGVRRTDSSESSTSPPREPFPIILTLPVPPITNTMYRTTRDGHVYKKPEVVNYQRFVQAKCMAQRLKPFLGPIKVTVDWYREHKIGDLDGRLKIVLDALQGHAYGNDAQIVDIHARRIDGDPNPRIVVEVTEWNS